VERQDADSVPGVLVANIFRKSADLAERQRDPSSEILRRARQTNVLLLRTFDLYHLLTHARAGRDAGKEIVAALGRGGGWLRATPDGIDFIT
jgi:hypothetical protein